MMYGLTFSLPDACVAYCVAYFLPDVVLFLRPGGAVAFVVFLLSMCAGTARRSATIDTPEKKLSETCVLLAGYRY
jgi:hypothetical protein